VRGRPKRKRFDPPKPVTQFDHLMIALAADRSVVQLENGKTARLIAWKPRRAGGHGKRMNGHCRVEFPGGGRATLPIRLVAGIINQDGAIHYLSEEEHGSAVHDAGGGAASRGDLPDARQRRDARSDPSGMRSESRQRTSPPHDGRGTADGDRGVRTAPLRGGDPQGLRGRNPVGTTDRKGTQQ